MSSFVDLVRPQAKLATRFFDVAVVILGSCFVAMMAQISIPLWFTPVPITMQTFALLMLAGLLGTKRGVAATVLYLAQGAVGLPVFAGFSGGIAKFAGPTAGYLLGFVLCVYVVGTLLERGWRNNFYLTFLAMALGIAMIYVPGVLCLSVFVGGLTKAFSLGVYPFLPGALFKVLAACTIIPSGWKWINSLR